MRYSSRLRTACFVAREKRFFAHLRLPDGSAMTAHLANTGSMRGCAEVGAPVRIWDSQNPGRKLRYSVEQICIDGRWILVNTARPNTIVEEALLAGVVPELAGYPSIWRERRPEGTRRRLDFLLEGPAGRAWVEVKNVTLLEGDVLRFPDAVTERGRHHLDVLVERVRQGERAVLFFHVGHEGGRRVEVARDVDPAYAAALDRALASGVEVLCWRSRMSDAEVVLSGPVPYSR